MLFLSAIVSTADNASTLSSEAITDSIASDANYGYMGMEQDDQIQTHNYTYTLQYCTNTDVQIHTMGST